MASRFARSLFACSTKDQARNLLDVSAAPASATTDNTVPRFTGTSGDLQTSGVSIDDSDNVTIPGTLTVTGGQIVFPATQNASASPNTLDDYEEGTFTPTLTTNGVDFDSVTYDAVRSGSYTKIGNAVLFSITMKTDAITVGSATGAVVIGALPFAAGLSSSQFFAQPVGYAANWAGEEPLSALIQGTASIVNLYYRTAVDGNNAQTAVADAGTGANANEVYVGGYYHV